MREKNCIKNVTFLLTLYNAQKDEIEYWKSIYLSFKARGINFKWLFDKSDKNEIPNFIENDDLYVAKSRRGKLNLVYEYIKEKKVNTTFFKTLDPDDTLSLSHLDMVEFPSEPSILTTGFFSHECYVRNPNTSSECIINPNAFWTASTFIPTKSIVEDELYKNQKVINQWEDDLLGYISFLNGYKWIKTEQPWYIYKINNGISNSKNIIDYLDEMDKVLSIFRMMQNKTGIFIENDFPKSIKLNIEKNHKSYDDKKIRKAYEILNKYGVN